MFKHTLFFTLATLLLLSACTQQADNRYDTSETLAKVNGEAITEYQLQVNIESLFGSAAALNTKQRKNILDAMILSRIIRQQAEINQSDTEKALIEQKAKIYKEKITVNDYLKNNIRAVPVSTEMISEYYNKHPEQFAAEEVLHYALLTTKNRLSEEQRNKLLVIYARLNKNLDLQTLQQRISEAGIELNYQKSSVRPGVLNTQIENVIHQLQAGQTSSLIMQQGRPYIVKLLSRNQHAAKPLSVVSGDIRKKLLPVALKTAIKQQTDKLKDNARIEYLSAELKP